ncbi:YrdB family protein [Haloarchaeobius sp. DT45]|uniref:YrdB family protein n=1 Tax=Haloarchaeobius sp. DT45 TaxID=3446116 RepID=UPI003F6C66D5
MMARTTSGSVQSTRVDTEQVETGRIEAGRIETGRHGAGDGRDDSRDIGDLGVLAVVVLASRFLLELGVLVALGYWGFRAGDGSLVRYGLALGLPLLAAVVWGLFVSPKARVPLRGLSRLSVELAVFGGGSLALYAAGFPALAVAFAVVAVVNRALVARFSLEAY